MKHRITGTLVKWRGKFGWIVPDTPVQHPLASQRGGRIYMDGIDVEKEISGQGAHVSFFVYKDEDGLGAQNVIPAPGGKGVQNTIAKSQPLALQAKGKQMFTKGAGKNKGLPATVQKEEKEKKAFGPPDLASRITLDGDVVTGTVVDWHGEVGWIKPDVEIDHEMMASKKRRKGQIFIHQSDCTGETPLINAKVTFMVYTDNVGVGAEICEVMEQGDGIKPEKPQQEVQTKAPKAFVSSIKENATGKGVGKAAGKAAGKGAGKTGKKGAGKEQQDRGPSGPDLPRERVSDEVLVGEVASWRGRTGWIIPSEPIDHAEAQKHGGKIYCHRKDITTGEETLEKGTSVQFCLFKDASGLGAEEVIPL